MRKGLFARLALTGIRKNGKIYYYTINGQNGKVCGELPVDYKKLSLVSTLITGVVFLLGLAGGLLL